MNKVVKLFLLICIIAIFQGCTPRAPIHDVPQYNLFPELYGAELLDSLRANYKPEYVLSYNDARDLLYSHIFNNNGTVTCIYTSDTIFIDPVSETPRTDAFSMGWNTEHIMPQSKGASIGRARSDLHHLQPIRADVNSSRSNFPFVYLEAEEVTRWWNGSQRSDTIPDGDQSIWSKTKSRPAPAGFEVRDETKGNVARAMFYFYTVYRDKVDSEFFYGQVDVLLQYHNQDHVDYYEYKRTYLIADVQNGKINPFIVDTTLARRAFTIDYTQ